MSDLKKTANKFFNWKADAEFVKMALETPEIDRAIQAVLKEAEGWESLPKGWTDESARKFLQSLTGDAKHKITKCMERMKSHMDEPGAFCGSLVRQFGKEARIPVHHFQPDPLVAAWGKMAEKKTFTVNTTTGTVGVKADEMPQAVAWGKKHYGDKVESVHQSDVGKPGDKEYFHFGGSAYNLTETPHGSILKKKPKASEELEEAWGRMAKGGQSWSDAYRQVAMDGFEAKDKQRIDDIASKALDQKWKMQDLARRMAQSITGYEKAIRRGLAAQDENYHDLATIFFNRAVELFHQGKTAMLPLMIGPQDGPKPKGKIQLKGTDIRHAYYTTSDGVQAFLQAMKKEDLLEEGNLNSKTKDQVLWKAYKELDAALNKVHAALEAKYHWD